MKTTKKFTFKKVVLYLLLTLLAGAGIFLSLPSNYFVHRALINWMPKIDQYPIFENRVVKAQAPQPWEMAPNIESKRFRLNLNRISTSTKPWLLWWFNTRKSFLNSIGIITRKQV